MQQVLPSAFLVHGCPSLWHGMHVPFVPLHVSPSWMQQSKFRAPILPHGAPCGRQQRLNCVVQWPLQHCSSAVQSGPLMKFWKSP